MTRTMDRPTRTTELLNSLADGVELLTCSAEWRRYLEIQGRFYRYSYADALLIARQFPDATQVAGFSAWRRMHRVVRRGERAIWILAPLRSRNPGAEGDEVVERVRGFRAVAVFDLSQTEGEPLPAPFSRLEGGDPDGAYDRLCALASRIDWKVQLRELAGGVNGDCSHATRIIRVEVRNAPAQRVKTLAHELAHALMHERVESRGLAELEAESAAYVVCATLGIDSSDYSLGYVATWAGGGPAAATAIRQSCARIQRAAGAILSALGAAVEV